MPANFVDIHCHLLPGIDDGANDLEEALAMARLAVEDGITTTTVTPHQLGSYRCNEGDDIRRRTQTLQQALNECNIPLRVLPGADVRIDDGLVEGLVRGDVLTLGDHRRHVLLELPHELYLPLEPILERLARHKMTGVLSHPERNHGILREPTVLGRLVDAGCLMQVTAGSLCGTFGPLSQELAESMLHDGLVHFIATDAHGVRSRRPLMHRAFQRACELTDKATATALCCENPAQVAKGLEVVRGRRATVRPTRGFWKRRQPA